MSADQKKEWPQIVVLTFAVFAFAWFPFGFPLMFMSGKQLLFGFDDFPLGPMVLGFGLGVLLALTGVTLVYRSLSRGGFRLPLIITITAVVLSAVSVPAARFMSRIEQERRYRQLSPNQPAAGNAGMASWCAIGYRWLRRA